MRSGTVFIVLLCVAAALAAGCLGGLPHPAAVPPEIVPVEGAALERSPVYTFPFETGTQTIQIAVDPAVYAGARRADRSLYLYENLSKDQWLPIYYLAFINDTDQDPFYDALLTRFQAIREQEGLDSDRYLELIAVFVQSIPYRTDDALVGPKFPIETYVDGHGDCDDKSLLLAALLARAGYDTALLYFDDEQHMAVGVRAGACAFRDTGYAYIEATNVSYVGLPPARMDDGTVLHSDPLVIPVGGGTGAFGRCDETREIGDAIERSLARVEELEPEIVSCAGELQALKEDIEALQEQVEAFRRPGDAVRYNRLVREYNALAAEYNSICADLQRYAGIYNYLTTHAHDRPGSYAWLQKHMPA